MRDYYYRTRETATIEKVKEALLSLGEVLQEAEAIGIFGSLARGEGFTKRSDIDIFVVVKETPNCASSCRPRPSLPTLPNRSGTTIPVSSC